MNEEQFKDYKRRNPYHIWAYRSDGSKFVAHFRDKREANRWAGKTNTRLGNTTNASRIKRKRRRTNTRPPIFGTRFPIDK